MSVYAMGLDIGFRKTGIAVVEVTTAGNFLKFAATAVSDNLKMKYKVDADLAANMSMLDQIEDVMQAYPGVKGLFVESPHGGAQGARAAHCMGMAKGVLSALLFYNHFGFEVYSPTDVETALGIKLTPGEAKKMLLKKSQRQAWKKERIKERVIIEWPEFNNWPTSKTKAEDAYDAAAAVLCGIAHDRLFKEIKANCGRETEAG